MTNTKHTPEAQDLADAILKAAGSGLRHYTMAKTREAILAAAQRGIDEARSELLEALIAAVEDEPDACFVPNARKAIAKAKGGITEQMPDARPIVIEVRSGVVVDVQNMPPGCLYEIKDHDDLEADHETAGGVA
jgi:hypothetical protein